MNTLDANLGALLGAIAYKLKTENKVKVFLLLPDHMGVFFRNGLVAHLSGNGNENKYEDTRQSTIPLTSFSQDEDDKFSHYLKNDFFGHRGLDELTMAVKKNLRGHFEEVFVNVGLHANTTHPVFTCGQYYPETRVLKFTLVDLGEGFLKKISKQTNGSIAKDNEAIIWATEGLNTTKDIKTFGPGGMGLKELKRYCEDNNGSFHICSGANYVNFVKNQTYTYPLPEPLAGSMINLIFRGI